MPDWIQIALRSLLTLSVLFVVVRILGKRQLSNLSYFDYISGIAIGTMAGFISFNTSVNWIYAFVAMMVWAGVVLGLSLLELKSKKLRGWLSGKGTVLIKDGKVMEDNLKKVRYSSDELLAQLRMRNAFSVADVEFAVLESSGEVSVLLKKEQQPITAKLLGMKIPTEHEPQTVIMDGKIMDEPLATAGRNRQWLHTELEQIGVSLHNVYLAQVNTYGELYVDLYDDKIQVQPPQPRPMLLATLKKCAADIELFHLSTDNPEAKALYKECMDKLNTMISDLKPYLEA